MIRRTTQTAGFLALLLAVLLLAAPAFGQCTYDSGEVRPASECGDQGPGVHTPAGGGALSLTTLFAANNSNALGGGVYFDLENVGAQDIEIAFWGINSAEAGPYDVDVYSRTGTYAGNETSLAGWTLMGTDTGILGNGLNVETPVLVGGLILQPGDVFGIAMGGPTGPGFDYTNGTGGNETYNNGDLELRAGSSNNVAFSPGTVFSPRVWNGVVYYDFAAAPVMEIPTLGESMLILLSVLLFAAGIWYLRRARTAG